MSEKKIIYCDDIVDSVEAYKNYIDNHVRAVQNMYHKSIDIFKEVFPDVYKEDSDIEETLLQNLSCHDESKFDVNEFWPYLMRFFPPKNVNKEYISTVEKCKDNFEIAWLHHVNNNKHHPAYWCMLDDNVIKIFTMSDIYVIEMLCDWMAMSEYYNSTTLSYWESESAQKLPMSPKTKDKVNRFMDCLKKYNLHNEW